MHQFICIQLDRDIQVEIKVNLTQEEIDTRYNSKFDQKITGPLFNVLAKLLQPIAGIDKIIIPGEFKSGTDKKSEAVACSYKVSEGFLYPLKSSLIFIQKPILYLKHKEIKYVEFSRMQQASRTFDLTIVKMDNEGSQKEQFKNIEKAEIRALMNYFKVSNIKMRQLNADTNKPEDMEDVDSEQFDEEIKQSQSQGVEGNKGVTVGRSGRRRVPVSGAAAMNMNQLEEGSDLDEDSEDGSFNENKSSESGEDGSEEGEDDSEDNIDDDKIDKEEMAHLVGKKAAPKKKK